MENINLLHFQLMSSAPFQARRGVLFFDSTILKILLKKTVKKGVL